MYIYDISGDGIIYINERSWPLVDKLSLGQRRDPEVPLGRILVVITICIRVHDIV